MELQATGRKRLPRAERERQILEVAEKVFATGGYQNASMDNIAAGVGLSKPMLYEYFGSKEGLLLACLQRAKQELYECTAEAARNAEDTRQLLYECLLAFFRFGDDHAQAWALLRNESAIPGISVNSELESIRSQQTAFTAGLLEAARPDLDAARLEAFAEAIIGACERLALWRERDPSVSPEQVTDHLLALIGPSLNPR